MLLVQDMIVYGKTPFVEKYWAATRLCDEPL